MSIFAIGDTHLSLSGEKPMDVFGGEWENHAERLKKNWEESIGPDDVVIVAGDVSWALKQEEAIDDLMWLAALPGKKVLVKGNHDLWWASVSRLNALDPSLFFIQNNFYDAGGVAICGSRGWLCPGDSEFTEHDEKIYKRELLRLEASLGAAEKAGFKEKIVAMHYPPANDRKEVSGFCSLIRDYGAGTVVYGHLHGQESFRKGVQGDFYGARYALVSLDFLGCRPVLVRS
ncbi:MAG: metallophosphoesterase [Clostridiales Family XIII bacterium]|jgi:predicted phosphohydrolase|nr:metallophosphoesterase [Clostridiales Family XIII bacterium]